jgi:hypothetical protein
LGFPPGTARPHVGARTSPRIFLSSRFFCNEKNLPLADCRHRVLAEVADFCPSGATDCRIGAAQCAPLIAPYEVAACSGSFGLVIHTASSQENQRKRK